MAKLLTLLALVVLAAAWWRGRALRKRARMPVEEARALLGVAETAGADEIRAAHRRLMARVHPDAGGSAELARRTNMARDLLLARIEQRRQG
jgi:DnaJ homolog subfamily C member 19